jgi:K+-transporting ATPase KdpF subunit
VNPVQRTKDCIINHNTKRNKQKKEKNGNHYNNFDAVNRSYSLLALFYFDSKRRQNSMTLLLIVSILMFAYLAYTLIKAERF